MAGKKFGKKRPASKALSSRLAKLEKKVAVNSSEIQYNEISGSYVPGPSGLGSASGGGSIVHLTGLASGDTPDDYSGTGVIQKSLIFRYKADVNDTAATSNVRVMIVRFKEENGSPTLAQVLANTTSEPHAQISYYLAKPSIKYEVLYDKQHTLVKDTVKDQVVVHANIDLGDKRQDVNKNSTAWIQNATYLMAFGDDATNRPGFTYDVKFRYHD